jgi:hypothetical protein
MHEDSFLIDVLSASELLDTYPGWQPNLLSNHIRESYVLSYGYSIVTRELLEALIPHLTGKVVEVMAGCGWLSANLQKMGIHIEPSDNFSWRHPWSRHTEVKTQDAVEAVKDADTIIMVWPYHDDGALKVMHAMKVGATLLYCGEDTGVVTGHPDFCKVVCANGPDPAITKVHLSFEETKDAWYIWRK